KMMPPKRALAIGGVCYGIGAFCMINYYYKNSSLKKIFVNADRQYEQVKVGHHA
ncbi:uncharacterized protein CANTADRAFT_56352, partial [Suhomyces tanzawaensis NRRL Y-17324]